ncbi:hypothetical protein LUZ61_009562 [Rhynchospora tenuis]|uniref:Trichome birefringence-like N-terminal domain-containing protein n=1 Tax=Rhynchospora tenuis TaxID=198213 RepID=A0AAD5ZXF6_9POAL|nr:hypothetical protein LUZ61_009562 [Rhynchospora tenuis]
MVLIRSYSNRSRNLNRGMKLWSLNGMKSKQIKLFIIVIFTACIIWGWDKASRPSVLVLHPDPLSLFRPDHTRYLHQHPSSEEDFPSEENFAAPIVKVVEKVHALPPTGSNSVAKHTSDASTTEEESTLDKKECNYGKGRWVADERRPLYSGFGCKRWLSEGWACRLTQRTDFSYEKFKWQPEGCDMPDFDGPTFLKRMQDKTIAYVGDSLGRQMFQSMMCMVTGGNDTTDVVDVGARMYGFTQPAGAKRPNGWAYHFPSTNTTILYYWSSTLCDLQPQDISNPGTRYAMHLDRPPSFLRENLHRFDVLVLNTGHHWNRGKMNSNKWDMYINGLPNNDKKLALIWKAKNFTIHSIVKWLDNELPHHPNLKAFMRTLSPRHFFNGEWDSGGRCDNNNPMSRGYVVSNDSSEDPDADGAVRDTRVRLLDITGLSRLRDEGHISKYSINAARGVQDCLHWCLPGIPDTWNEILAAQL